MEQNEEGIQEIAEFPQFWERMQQAEQWFLGLDYDGTLAPFHLDPMQARPLEGVVELIGAISTAPQTEVAIISGRPVTEVMTLLGHPPVTVVGSHGFECWPVDGARVIRPPSPVQRQGLAIIERWITEQSYGHKLECKVASLAVHTRGLEPAAALAIEEQVAGVWGEQAPHFELECRRFNGGVEIRCLGWDKGAALSELLNMRPDSCVAVYVGDDETDEDAFAALRGRGIGIKVGDASWPTSAQGFLPDCRAVVGFLRTWVSLLASTKEV